MSKKEIIENVSTEENELVEAIKDTDATDEDVVEAVAEAIKEEAEKQEKTVEEVVNEIVEESKDEEKSDEKNLDKKCKLRGFESYKHAKDYLKSESFEKLDSLNQAELEDWFENLK